MQNVLIEDALTIDNATLTLADRVFSQIQDAIVKGELLAGAKISEAELTTRYGVSRGPLREALRRLEARKLLTRIPHVGVRVVELSIAELLEMYQVREVLEGMAARLAAIHATDEDVTGLKALLTRHQQQTELLCGELYHRVRLYRYQFSVTAGRPHKAFAEHSRIIEAIESRDGELAEFLMRRHISSARKNVETHYHNKVN